MTIRTFYCADCGQPFQTTRDSQSRCNPCRVEAGDKPLYDDEDPTPTDLARIDNDIRNLSCDPADECVHCQ
jgi:hypothetical protein